MEKKYKVKYFYSFNGDYETGVKLADTLEEAKKAFYEKAQVYEHDDEISGCIINNEQTKPNRYYSYDPQNQLNTATIEIEEYNV